MKLIDRALSRTPALTAGVLWATVPAWPATTRHVWADSPAPAAPYANWATAAHVIQDAVDAATVTGGLVLVTNGTYAGRVRVTKPLALQSVNGPGATVITGEGGGGGSEVGCVYLASGASLSGFTVTKGSAGGVYAESVAAVITNCTLTGNSAGWEGGGAYGGTLNNCTLTGNSAPNGGGAYWAELNNCTLTGNGAMYGGGACGGTLNDCTLADNSATYGGGAAAGTLNHCTLTGNSAERYGSGAYGSTLNHCTLTRNSGSLRGGGAESGTLNHCTLTGNSAGMSGGGADGGTLNHCTLTGNSAANGGGVAGGTLNHCVLTGNSATGGGGVAGSTLNNCTLTGNSASDFGGGAGALYDHFFGVGCTLNNCIVYRNTAPNGADIGRAGFDDRTPFHFNNCWVASSPRFVDRTGGNLRLQPDSPCINAGNNAYASGTTDLDGLPRVVSGTVDIGAYEFRGSGSVISYAWLQSHGLPTDGPADFADPDTDGRNTWQEWRCLSDPTNALSVLRLLSATPAETGVTVSWPGVEGVTYFLERSPNLGASPPFTPLATNLSGPSGTQTFTDTNATASPTGFYRVGVGP